jgi:HD superfamily phosphohydrolase
MLVALHSTTHTTLTLHASYLKNHQHEVANKRNGIDVDKFDYLIRDSRSTNVGVPLDFDRLMLFSRLSPGLDEVVFKQTEYSNLAVGLFQTRAEMHRRVYTHQ